MLCSFSVCFFTNSNSLPCIQLSIFLIGLVGNCLCIHTFSRMLNKRNFHHLMMATAMFDLLYITCSLILFSVPHLSPKTATWIEYKLLIPTTLPLANVGLTGMFVPLNGIPLHRVCRFHILHACHRHGKVYYSLSPLL